MAAVAAPAIAQSMPETKWRMTSGFPKSLDTIYGGAKEFSKDVAEATDNKFQIQLSRPAKSCQACRRWMQPATAPSRCAHRLYYSVGKDPTFAFGTAVPFGLNARMQNAWWCQGGGMELSNEFFRKFSVIGFPCGNTGCQMGGWFRKEIKAVADLSGLKFRIGGIAGQVLQKLGVVPQQIAGGDIYPALEKGTSRGRVGRAVRRREARIPEGRGVLLLSRMVGRRRDDPQLHQPREVEFAAEELSGDRRQRDRECQHLDGCAL